MYRAVLTRPMNIQKGMKQLQVSNLEQKKSTWNQQNWNTCFLQRKLWL